MASRSHSYAIHPSEHILSYALSLASVPLLLRWNSEQLYVREHCLVLVGHYDVIVESAAVGQGSGRAAHELCTNHPGEMKHTFSCLQRHSLKARGGVLAALRIAVGMRSYADVCNRLRDVMCSAPQSCWAWRVSDIILKHSCKQEGGVCVVFLPDTRVGCYSSVYEAT